MTDDYKEVAVQLKTLKHGGKEATEENWGASVSQNSRHRIIKSREKLGFNYPITKLLNYPILLASASSFPSVFQRFWLSS